VIDARRLATTARRMAGHATMTSPIILLVSSAKRTGAVARGFIPAISVATHAPLSTVSLMPLFCLLQGLTASHARGSDLCMIRDSPSASIALWAVVYISSQVGFICVSPWVVEGLLLGYIQESDDYEVHEPVDRWPTSMAPWHPAGELVADGADLEPTLLTARPYLPTRPRPHVWVVFKDSPPAPSWAKYLTDYRLHDIRTWLQQFGTPEDIVVILLHIKAQSRTLPFPIFVGYAALMRYSRTRQ
jgi:hypothetical protein